MIQSPERVKGNGFAPFCMRVLLIEDVEVIRNIVRSELERAGFDVIDAKNGREGLRLALESLPDVILSDYSMPELNGLEMLEKLRHSRNASHIPFILMSSYPGRYFGRECERLGVNAFLEKPFDFSNLMETMHRVLTSNCLSNPVEHMTFLTPHMAES